LSRKEKAYQESDIQFLQRVAGQVSLAVDNVTHRKNALAYQHQLAAERDQLELLLEVNNLLVSNLEVSELFPAVAAPRVALRPIREKSDLWGGQTGFR